MSGGERAMQYLVPEDYWVRKLAGAGRPRFFRDPQPGAANAPAEHRLPLPVSLAERLARVASGHDAGLFLLLLAGWATLLRRYTGADDLLIASSPFSGGDEDGDGGLVFFRLRLEDDAGLRRLLVGLRAELEQVYRYQDFDLDVLRGRLAADNAAEGVADERALLDTGLSFAPFNRPSLRLADLGLWLHVDRGREGLALLVRDGRGVYGEAFVRQLGRHFLRALDWLLVHADAPVRQAELLDEAEREELLVGFAGRVSLYPGERSLAGLVAEQAAVRPGEPAVVYRDLRGDRGLTYGELDRRANALAWRLVEQGVGAEDLVGVMLDRSERLVIALLAILKTGGAYLPLDPDYPRERLAAMLEDAGCPLVLADEASREQIAGAVVLEPGDCTEERDVPPPERASGRHLAYAIFTSGSTGRPKGVLVEQRSVARLVLGTDYVELGPGVRILQTGALSFDASTFEIWGALLHGGTLHLAPQEELLDAASLGRLLARHRIDCIWLTASLFNRLVESDASLFAPLSTLLVGGERLSPPHVERVLRAHPGLAVINGYGPTESTTFTACHRIREVSGDIPIGRPIANTRVYVLDGRGEPVPPGVAGDLYIAGDGLARGYLGRPGLTAERFVPHPFRDGERMYRSGDMARWTCDGVLEYLGRRDDQVKIRGFRIEPGEVRQRLLEHSAVGQAAVTARDLVGGRALVAYVVGEGLEAGELRRHLARTLPEFMLPARFVVLEHLPLDPNGKVDTRALPDPDALVTASGTHTPPGTDLERRLAAVWEEVLGLRGLGVDDSFFDLGGHSLQAAAIIERACALGLDLRLADLFEEPTVAGLAARAGERSGSPAAPPIPPAPRQGDLPLSFAQQRLWFLDRWQPGSAAYNLPGALRLRGRLDLNALATALAGVLARHEALRTTFEEAGGRPCQRVQAPVAVPLPVVDLSGLPETPESAREGAAEHLWAAEAARPFDLARGPLLRAHLLRLAAAEHHLLLSLHHIAGDAWSIGVLLREVGELYATAVSRRSPVLPALPIQYADYAVWQRRLAGEGALEPLLADWCDRLRGLPVLELPADRPRPPARTRRGATVTFDLPRELAAAPSGSGATPFMVLLAAWAALLARWTGQRDIAVGSPVAGRGRPELAGLIGCFVNTLVLRLDLAGDPTAAELLARVKEVVLAGLAGQEAPFEMLVERLEPERDAGRSPLFQVLFAMAELRLADLVLPGIQVSLLPLRSRTAKFDLSLAVEDTGRGLRAELEVDLDLFEPAAAERLRRRFVTLAATLSAAMASEPELRLSALPLLDEAERHQLLAEWNDTGTLAATPAMAAPLASACLHELVRAQAARTPDAPAVVSLTAAAGTTLTYAELDGRASRLAVLLRGAGVGPEVRVAVCARRSPDLCAGLLAVLQAGGAYVPLDPAYPRERLAFMLEDSGAAVLLVEEGLDLPAPGGAVRTVHLGDHAAVPSGVVPASAAGPDNLAYIIYTSGSTGRPKGVAIEHRSAAALLAWAAGVYGPGELAGVLASTSVCFDLSVFELFLPWSRGGAVVLAQDALELPAAAAFQGVTLLNTVPSAAAALLDRGGLPASVRTVNLAGEPLAPALVDELYRRGVERVFDLYGPSEDTTYSTWALRRPGGPATIGRPIAGTQAYLLDRDLSPVPAGTPGELCLAGAGLARGYLGRPGLTAAAFVPDPFSAASGEEPGGRLYRTGDLARHLPGGDLELLGRIDRQVKVRGFRVEPGEVEAALAAHPGVREAAVLAVRDARGGSLSACVVPVSAPHRLDPRELRTFLADRLPAALVPAAFVFLDELPRLPNGKLDRGALARHGLEPAGETSGGPTGGARTPEEELLATLCAGVLGRERVGVHDSFFELGGHSLLAVQLLSRVREACGVEIPLRALFAAPTVAGLAAAVAAARGGGASSLPPVQPASRGGEIPASFGQHRLWFLHRLDPAGTAYNVPAALLLEGSLDVAALEAALTELVRRHEALRTTLSLGSGSWPVQVIAPAGPVPLPLLELARAELDRQAAALAAEPFDLERGPLLRTLLARLDDRLHALVVVVHHAVCDGWSMALLLRELGALYGALAAGEPPSLPAPALQYADYAVWQRRLLEKDGVAPLLDFWRRQLASAEPLRLPLDRPRPRRPDPRGARLVTPLDRGVVAGLDALGRSRGATRFMVLLAAFQLLLTRYAGQDDVVVGSPVAHRDRLETEGIVGFLADALVLRTRGTAGGTVDGLLAAVRETVLAAHDHGAVPFERLVSELQPDRDPSVAPLFQVLFALRPAALTGLKMGDLRVEPLEVRLTEAQLDLTLAVEEEGERVAAAFEYHTALFDAPTIARMAGHLMVLLAAMADGETAVAALPWLTGAERHQLLAEWNDTGADLPGGTLHQRFAAQAARTPEAVALVLDGRQLSYGELDRRANRLAHHLHHLLVDPLRGAGPGVIVAVCLERSLEAVVGILGVLKAGGAYLPLDPAHPRERLALMLEDSGAAAVLTRAGLGEAMAGKAGLPVILLDAPETGWSSEPPAIPDCEEGRAYVIYTSGSTGRPKGVVISHRAIGNRLSWMTRRFAFGPDERFLQRTALVFDASVWELFVPLLTGARLVLARPAAHLDAPALVRTLAEERVTVMQCVPSLLRALLPDLVALAPDNGLRRVFCGGEELGRDLQEAFFTAFPETELHQLYGPTETAIDATWWECRRDSSGAGAVPIGRPLDNLQVHLLDRDLRPVPVGVAGELCAGGAGLARGYLGRPDLTAERFVPDPWSGPWSAGARLYRTGDLARRLPRGEIEFLGRLDQQVKIRGIRIEPGEVEAAVAACPGVREAAVVVRQESGGPRLVAYVAGGEIPELRLRLRQLLPAAMVPSAFVTLAELPRTPGGKLDRRALPSPEAEAAAWAAPASQTEELVAAAWREALARDRVGADDNFFDLGGHSLLMIQVHRRLQEDLGRDIDLVQLFEHTTVRALAEALDRPSASAAAPVRVADRAARQRQAMEERRQAAARRRTAV